MIIFLNFIDKDLWLLYTIAKGEVLHVSSSRNSYNTKQKALLLSLLESNAEQYISAKMLRQQLMKKGVSVALPTIYRHLGSLEKQGEIQRVACESSRTIHFRIVQSSVKGEQCALLCRSCGTVKNISCDHFTGMCAHLDGEHGFLMDSQKTVLQGICGKCRE